MNAIRSWAVSGLVLVLLSACVTINVYFPAAAAEKAADRIIREVWEQKNQDAPDANPGVEPSSLLLPAVGHYAEVMLGTVLTAIVPAAHAAADINVSSAKIDSLKASMRSRHSRLVAYFNSGAIGLTADGQISLRDPSKVPLKERGRLKKEIAAENRDRASLYNEIAQVNGHPEWGGEIRSTFARQWVSNARSGWWYQSGGGWTQK